MKSMKRALRRHHRRRMIAHAVRVFSSWGSKDYSDEEVLDRARREHDHLKSCSCWMCGNQRKWLGPTVQERRRDQRPAYDED